MKNAIKTVSIFSLISLLVLINPISVFAQTMGTEEPKLAAPQPATPQPAAPKPATPQPAAPQKGEIKQPNLKAQVVATECTCIKPGTECLQKAYNSLEEDDWSKAIKECDDCSKKIEALSASCSKCLELPLYKNIAKGFLNYAKGGSILDGEGTPNCTEAKKLYSEAIKLLDSSKISDASLKSNAQSIKDYCDEELSFVEDECQAAKN